MEETTALEIFLKNNRLPKGVDVVRTKDWTEICLGSHLFSAIMMSLVWALFGLMLAALFLPLGLLGLVAIGIYLVSYGTENVIRIDRKMGDFSIVKRCLGREKAVSFQKQTVLPVMGSLMDANGSLCFWLDIYPDLDSLRQDLWKIDGSSKETSRFRISDGTSTEDRFQWTRRLILAIRDSAFTKEEQDALAAFQDKKRRQQD